MASSDQYPPRFTVDVSGSDMTEASDVYFIVSGAVEELSYKLTMTPPPS